MSNTRAFLNNRGLRIILNIFFAKYFIITGMSGEVKQQALNKLWFDGKLSKKSLIENSTLRGQIDENGE